MLQDDIKIKNLTRRKLYDPYINNYEYFSVDEKLPIEIKSRIPHWVPSRNSDIFEVRKIMVKEKEQLKELNRSIGTYKIKNELLISKNILEDESKKLNKRINRDISNRIINEEKLRNKHERNYVTESRYQEINKYCKNKNILGQKKNINLHPRNNFETERVSQSRSIDLQPVLQNAQGSDISNVDAKNNKLKNKDNKKEKADNKTPILSNRNNETKILKIENNKNIDKKIEEKTKNVNSSILITATNIVAADKLSERQKDEMIYDIREKSRFNKDLNVLNELQEEKVKDSSKENVSRTETKENIMNKLTASTDPNIGKSSSLRTSVKEYINKTREIVLLRHSVEIKKETALRMEEEYHNQIESVKQSIVSLKQAKDLFEDEFFIKFDKYIKYLRVQREKELNELNNILDEKSQLELEIQKIEAKKNKTRDKLNLYREYRDFLISVKERTLNLPNFFLKSESFKNNFPVNLDFFKTKNSRNFVSNQDYNVLNSERSWENESEKNKILEKEKLNIARNLLLNQLQTPSSCSKNVSPTNNTIKNTKLNNSNGRSNKNVQIVNFNNSDSNKNIININNLKSNLNSTMNKKQQNSGWLNTNGVQNLNSSHEMNTNNNSFTNNGFNFNINPVKEKNKTSNIEVDPILIGIEFHLIEKFNKYISKPIYETPDDLNEDIKKLQTENINLLKRLAATSSKVNLFNQELKKMRQEDSESAYVLLYVVQQRENNIKKLADINKSLLEEKNMVLNEKNVNYFISKSNDGSSLIKKDNFRKSLVKSKFNQAILYSKINEIFNLCLEMGINSKVNRDVNINISNKNQNNNLNMSFLSSNSNNNNMSSQSNKKSVTIDKESNMMYMLKIMEKSIDYLFVKLDGYKKDAKKSILLEKMKSDLDKERKINKAIEARLKDEKRREILNAAIIERNDRGIILPRRKVPEKMKPLEKIKKNDFVKKNKEEASNFDMILYQ